MALPRTPLDPASLSDAARKALGGPGPLRMMAARGLAPLPRPADLVSVMYALSLDAEAPIKQAAEKTADGLPEKVLAAALADVSLDARVLDFFAPRIVSKPAVVEALLLNKATADETVAELTAKLGEREIEIVATNEQRLLRCPAVIGAMYLNTKARMSTVDRAIELAVRNKVTVPGIPAWDDVVAAVLGLVKAPPTPEQAAAGDAAFQAVSQFAVGDQQIDDATLEMLLAEDEAAMAAQGPLSKEEHEKRKTSIAKLSIPAKIRLATIGNSFARATLIRDSNKQVALAAIKSPGVNELEAAKYAANRGLIEDVVRVIAQNREWTRQYGIKLALVQNPKCPLAFTMKFLPLLQDKDIKNIAKSKGIPSALAQQARRLVAAKTGGQGK
jgi:hypothetical protein